MGGIPVNTGAYEAIFHIFQEAHSIILVNAYPFASKACEFEVLHVFHGGGAVINLTWLRAKRLVSWARFFTTFN